MFDTLRGQVQFFPADLNRFKRRIVQQRHRRQDKLLRFFRNFFDQPGWLFNDMIFDRQIFDTFLFIADIFNIEGFFFHRRNGIFGRRAE